MNPDTLTLNSGKDFSWVWNCLTQDTLNAARAPARQIAEEFGFASMLSDAFASAEASFIAASAEQGLKNVPLLVCLSLCGRQDGLVFEALQGVWERMIQEGTILSSPTEWFMMAQGRGPHSGAELRRLLDTMLVGARDAMLASLDALHDHHHVSCNEDEGGVWARL
jgi:hypothetical protein